MVATDRRVAWRKFSTSTAREDCRLSNCRHSLGPAKSCIPPWTERLLAGTLGYRSRAWLKARMPAFPAQPPGLRRAWPPSMELPRRRPGPADDPAMIDAGRLLTLKGAGLDCRQCHSLDGVTAKQENGAQGISFLYTAERLRYDYYQRWMLDPLRDRSADKNAADFRRPQAHRCHNHFGWRRPAPVRRTLAVHPQWRAPDSVPAPNLCSKTGAASRSQIRGEPSGAPNARRRSRTAPLADHAKAVVAVAVRGLVVVAIGTAQMDRRVVESAPAGNPHHAVLGTLRIVDRRILVIEIIVPVGTPLPDVAVHVVQAEGVGLKPADRRRPRIAVAAGQKGKGDPRRPWGSPLRRTPPGWRVHPATAICGPRPRRSHTRTRSSGLSPKE